MRAVRCENRIPAEVIETALLEVFKSWRRIHFLGEVDMAVRQYVHISLGHRQRDGGFRTIPGGRQELKGWARSQDREGRAGPREAGGLKSRQQEQQEQQMEF